MKKKDRLYNGWFYILLASMLFLWAYSQTIEPASSHESKTRESSMSIEKGLPPMDTAAPSNYETASFGLG
ncbi:hypothetical protein ACFL2E_06820 [Thermodesulfobacteriota bacterium]